ncbi:hypothetical protein [Planctobacterium marinum]|uniref:Uncharacterized protein n=1 Tax=Planctobacterium marinum TaxID=1631968 RepID=A0AA48HIT7_9ALTE|nr:hypothetical protein MACH26_32090 [Planctobacterium marinum]
MSRQQTLLMIVAVLAVLQFLVVPAFDWLDTQRISVIAEQQKAQKEQALLQARAPLEAQLAEVDSYLSSITQLAFTADSMQMATLAIQGIVEKSAEKHDVKINRISWVEPDGKEQLHHKIEIFIEAYPSDWVALQSDLEGKSWLLLDKMNFFYSRRTGDTSLIGRIRGGLSFNVNVWIENDSSN